MKKFLFAVSVLISIGLKTGCYALNNDTIRSVENLKAEIIFDHMMLTWSAVEGTSYYGIYSTFFGQLGETNDTVYYWQRYRPAWENCLYVKALFEDGTEICSDTVCIGPEALDFIATDCHGNEIHLFDILDSGKFVMIDYFWFTCSGCRLIMPNIVETYYRYGCNKEDIFYMEVDQYDDNEKCLQWCEEFGVKFPTISNEGGGIEIATNYFLSGAPHYFLIAPDHTILFDNNTGGPFTYYFGFSDLQSVIDVYETLGIEEHPCFDAVCEESPETFGFPNPADGFVNLSVDESGMVRVYNTLGQMIDSFVAESGQTHLITENYPNGLYFVQMDGCSVGRFVVNHR